MQVLDRIRRDLRRLALIGSETAIAAAVSGGSDSVALAHALARLAADGEIRFAGIAHFNHQLRDTSNDDEKACRRLADALRVPFVGGRSDVRSRAAEEGRSIEDAARRARYEFFDGARAGLAAGVVALGHTRDDQAETFLLRLLRGAGPRGLASMYPRNGTIVRPLLGCRRVELRDWLTSLAARGVPCTAFVEDETNADVTIPRNRVRAELLPLLESRFNPEIVDVLADEADLARDSWAIVERAGAALGVRPRGQTPGSEFDVDGLLAVDPAIARVALWRAMVAAAGGREVGYRHVAAAMDLIHDGGDRSIDAPGHRVERIGGRVVLTSRPAGTRGRGQAADEGPNGFCQPLSVPGEVTLSDLTRLSVEAMRPGDAASVMGGAAAAGRGSSAFVRADLCGSLAVRNRRPGDRFRPVGVGGAKKLQDLFVDRKVARLERDRIPLVVDGADRIVWVAGHGIDEAFAVTDAAQAVLLLRLTRP
jgi:tRNA(Ile)-lysidine synthase